MVLVVVNAENKGNQRTCAAVVTRLLHAGHKIAVIANITVASAGDEFIDLIFSQVAAEIEKEEAQAEAEASTDHLDDAEREEAVEARMRDAKKRVNVQTLNLRDAAAIPDAIAAVVRRFYSIDAVVNLLRPTDAVAARCGTVSATSADDYDEIFDLLVRASFVVAREALPHLARSEGPRKIVAFCPPPLAVCDVFRPAAAAVAVARETNKHDGDKPFMHAAAQEEGPVLALARACQGLHMVGQAAEFAELDPPIAVNGLWPFSSFSSPSHDRGERDEDRDVSEAVTLMLAAPATSTAAPAVHEVVVGVHSTEEKSANATTTAAAASPQVISNAEDVLESEKTTTAADPGVVPSKTFWRVESVIRRGCDRRRDGAGAGAGADGVANTAEKVSTGAIPSGGGVKTNIKEEDEKEDDGATLHPMTTTGVRDVRLPGYTTRNVVFPDLTEPIIGRIGSFGGMEATMGWGM